MLTPERLKAIKERCERATKGPWKAEPEVDKYGCETGSYWLCMGKPEQPMAYEFDRAEDAEFCAHARDDVPALVAEVERLWAFARELREEIGRLRYAAEVAKGVADAHRGNWCDVAFAEGKAEGLLEAVSVVDELLAKLEAKQHAQ